MLKEYPTLQHEGEPKRRWFSDSYFDIYVWEEHNSVIIGFQICYDKDRNERALTWVQGTGFSHNAIDAGEISPTMNQSSLLSVNELYPANELLEQFISNSVEIEQRISSFIIEKLQGLQSAGTREVR